MAPTYAHAMGCHAAKSSGSAYHFMPVLWCPNCTKQAAKHVWPLLCFTQDCSALFPQDSKIVCLEKGWPRSSKSLALSPQIPHNINLVPSANTVSPGMANTIGHNWHRSRFPCISKLPTLGSGAAPDTVCPSRTKQRLGQGWQVSVRESTHGLKVLDPVPAKVCPDRPGP